ncbi:MAG TPA: RNA polymerase subunit sigma [Caproiciproducens sp.]|nr:RNA polymerase subunit sigma [Caproiciproducens sp.]
MDEIDQLAVKAAEDTRSFEALIHRCESFILKCASKGVHRYITKSDDEWSIALQAFSQAVGGYSPEKGRFLSFAEVVIHRKLVDYLRSQAKYRAEISINPAAFDSPVEEEQENPAMQAEVSEKIAVQPDDSVRLEIESISRRLSDYGFSFFDLTDCSPKAEKTKTACAKAVACLIQNPVLFHYMQESKLLPVKLLEKQTKLPRKILERHRKYIIAAAEIITGDYPCLAEYMRFIRKELGNESGNR